MALCYPRPNQGAEIDLSPALKLTHIFQNLILGNSRAPRTRKKHKKLCKKEKQKMTKKVIALFDVDGTLTVPRKQITPGKF